MQHTRGLLLALSLTTLLLGCATAPDQVDAERRMSAAQLYDEARAALRRGDTETALGFLETLQVRFPRGEHALQAQLDIILAYYEQEEYDLAITAAEQFRTFHPRSPHGAYAQYMIGRSEEARLIGLFDARFPKDYAEYDQRVLNLAYRAYQTLVNDYPESNWRGDALTRIAAIDGHAARHELNTARFYFERGAYVGATNRLHALLTLYPDSEYQLAGLELLYQSYRAQGLREQAESILDAIREVDPEYRIARLS